MSSVELPDRKQLSRAGCVGEAPQVSRLLSSHDTFSSSDLGRKFLETQRRGNETYHIPTKTFRIWPFLLQSGLAVCSLIAEKEKRKAPGAHSVHVRKCASRLTRLISQLPASLYRQLSEPRSMRNPEGRVKRRRRLVGRAVF